MFYECLIKFSNINCVLPVELIRKGFCILSELDDWSIRNGILLCYPGSCQTSSHLLAFCHLVILFLRKVNNFSLKSSTRYGFFNINIGTIVISYCLQFLGCVLWCKVEAVGDALWCCEDVKRIWGTGSFESKKITVLFCIICAVFLDLQFLFSFSTSCQLTPPLHTHWLHTPTPPSPVLCPPSGSTQVSSTFTKILHVVIFVSNEKEMDFSRKYSSFFQIQVVLTSYLKTLSTSVTIFMIFERVVTYL